MKTKRTWKEKLLDSKDLPKVKAITEKQEKRWGKGTIAIPSPLEVDSIMKTVPKGKVITINQIRDRIAKAHDATIGCPITTGIFSWIAANAAQEDLKAGQKVTPYWRTLKEGGIINEKYPGGLEKQAMLLEQEGHDIIQKGKNWVVADWVKAKID
ncbi:MGMT family protein [Segetibacter koreensis]|uniref:MGMT family protein n=1 Tax=Segetibacter koreensis TaxID=398037 RepID=UPI000376C711|nr:MGMT family protein [Segetibacter koreensis]